MSDRLPPQLAARYVDLEVLGKGAYGRVVKAADREGGREVAIKLLHPKIYADPGMMKRFRREAELTARISSPHVARVLDWGVEAGRPHIVFEFVDGPDLQDRLDAAGGHLPLPEAIRIYGHLLRAIAAAHAEGVLHRDLKPDNVLLHPEGRAVITDFGLSREFDSNSLTAAGEMIGTATHMTPQQLLGEEADASADLYAATLIFFEVAAGEDPFHAGNFMKLRENKMRGLTRGLRLRGVNVPRALDALVTRALSPMPEDRPQDAAAFLAEVEKALTSGLPPDEPLPPEVAASRQALWAALGLSLAFLAAVVFRGLGGP